MQGLGLPLILRVDVDNGYLYRKGLIATLLNYVNENIMHIPFEKLGYLAHLKQFLSELESLGIRASLFFKYVTLPLEYYANDIIKKGYEIGLHLLSAKTYEEFTREVKAIEKVFKVKIWGFTKHGDGARKLSRKHAWRYEPYKYIKWGIKYGVKYFSGNIHGAPTEAIGINNFIYFPKVFYVEPYARKIKLTLDNIRDIVSSGNLVVALIHPCNFIGSEVVRREFYKLIEYVSRIYTFIEYLRKLNSPYKTQNYNLPNRKL